MKRVGQFVLLALLVVFISLWVLLGDWIAALLSVIVLALGAGMVFAVVGYIVSNVPDWIRWIRGISWEDHLKRLEEEGKAFRENYQVDRAISFDDLGTSCHVYLLEVGEHRLLCLYGQYYYEFEPINDDPELNQPRKFPTKSFSLLRLRKSGEILKIIPGSDVIEPTICDGISRIEKIQDLGIQLEDGELIENLSFEEIEKTCISLAGNREPGSN